MCFFLNRETVRRIHCTFSVWLFLLLDQDPFHPEKNPKGYISLCVAENKLVLEELSTYLSKPHIAKIAFELEPQLSFCYSNFMGLAPLRQSVANLFSRKFKCVEDGVYKVKPDNIVVGSGCAGLLNVLFGLLADENDAVLIPAPYYAAFDNDMKVCLGDLYIQLYKWMWDLKNLMFSCFYRQLLIASLCPLHYVKSQKDPAPWI